MQKKKTKETFVLYWATSGNMTAHDSESDALDNMVNNRDSLIIKVWSSGDSVNSTVIFHGTKFGEGFINSRCREAIQKYGHSLKGEAATAVA